MSAPDQELDAPAGTPPRRQTADHSAAYLHGGCKVSLVRSRPGGTLARAGWGGGATARRPTMEGSP